MSTESKRTAEGGGAPDAREAATAAAMKTPSVKAAVASTAAKLVVDASEVLVEAIVVCVGVAGRNCLWAARHFPGAELQLRII